MGSILTEASSCVSSFSPRSISFCIRYITFFRSSSFSRNSDRICSTCGGTDGVSWGWELWDASGLNHNK